jgi:hypothetical protein
VKGRPPYEVIHVGVENIREDEQIGSKDKYWCELITGGCRAEWLLKLPRQEPEKGEHWAEKIGAEVAGLLGLPHATVELAEFQGVLGTVSKRFGSSENLVHGNEMLAGRVLGYDPEKKFRNSDHTFERILQVIQEVCGSGSCDRDLERFGGYLLLDAVIGNTDRHHQNWAFLRQDRPGGPVYELAPTFDHASSLGREMLDDRRQRILTEGAMGRYIRKGRGAIFLAGHGGAPLSPLELVLELRDRPFGKHLVHWLHRVANVTAADLAGIVSCIPDRWMSELARKFALGFMLESLRLLRQTST